MTPTRFHLMTSSLLACCGLLASHAQAALPIDLEVAKERGVSITAPQQWAQLLGQMDLGSVKIRDARGPERPKLEERNLSGSVRYRVTAILSRGNVLLLPDRRFVSTQRAAMKKYFEELPTKAEYNSVERGAFGLSKQQFELVYAEMSQPIGFSTVEKTAGEILSLVENKIGVPIAREDVDALSRGKPLSAELEKLTLGTTLAFALRQSELMLVPEQLPGQALRLTIEPYDSAIESWPIGWKPEVSSRQSAPHLFEKRTIEIKGFTLTQALTALQPAIRLPVLLDQRVLERKQIDPSKVDVELPKKRTFLKSAVSKLFSQARLSDELRVDELDSPFLWVTRFGKDSPRARK